MLRFALAGLLAAAALAAQQDVHVSGREMKQDGSVTRARGGAAITNGTVRIQADSINYNQATREAEAAGNVRIQFLAKPVSAVDSQPSPGRNFEERMRMMRRNFPPEIIRDGR
jgi:hypothetical protein